MMEDDQQFCLRWNNHQSTLISVFDTLLENEKLVDCTLAAEGRIMKAHKVVLSACSPYFATLLQEQYDKHPIFILKDVKYQELRAMMDYMYRGEVNISQDQLAALLKAAESLQIKGLSDNRTGTAPRAEQQQQQQQQQHHRGLNVPGGSKLSGGYTLEAQTKRARVGAGPLDTQDISGSREGSSSPSRRRRKVRRRSVENAMAEPHDNSNSSQQQQSSLLQSNAGLAGVSAITAAASALASQLPTVSGVAATANAIATTQAAIASAQQQPQQQQQQPGQQLTTTTSVTKKTENVKGTSDAINTENVQVAAVAGGTVATGIVDNEAMEHVKTDKQNHKQKQTGGSSGKEGSELVIEPKSEYDEEGNDETCEDLTLDDEDMGMDDLDQNAGTSQGGEGSSQGYAAWQHDRSQDEILLSTQEAQQRDPQDINLEQTQQDAQNQTQSTESRIRVRNWLMLADQSILEKSIKETDHLNYANASTNQTTALTAPPTSAASQQLTTTTSTATATAITTGTNTMSVPAPKPLPDPNVATMTRIGSIGRTTIACITPAGAMTGGKNSLNNGSSLGVVSAAALAAAGVELDTVDESMTEVIVKIENTATSDEEVEVPDEVTQNDDEERDMNYDLQLSSPMSWSYDAVKIEHEEEFEEFCAGDTNMDDDDDLLTTAAATTKQANADNAVRTTRSRSIGTKTRIEVSNAKKRTLQQTQQQIQQQQQRLLEQQQHLQHLNLQPNQPLQIKLASIPATITSIAPKPSAMTVNMNDSKQAADFHSSLSEDKRYRILIQNQRMRKESLEHSEDMIYNADIEKPWVCRNCNRNYKWKNSLKCHLKNECGQPPRYFCSKLCGYATNVHSNLKRHLNTKCRDRVEEESRNNSGNSSSNGAGNNNNSANDSTTYTLVLQNQD